MKTSVTLRYTEQQLFEHPQHTDDDGCCGGKTPPPPCMPTGTA
jgi:hypothetical protein